MAENIILGFTEIFKLAPILSILIGVTIGLIVGATPGINDTITMALLIPVTFGMSAEIAIPLLIGIYVSACYGGSLPAILLKIPGTVSSIMTTIDGHEMARKGEANLAIGISTYSSVFGGITSSLLLIFFTPFLARQALSFGPPEYFTLGILGMVGVSSVSQDIPKAIIVSLLALLLSTVGLGSQVAFYRFGLGTLYLMDGVPLVPVMIGLFGINSIFESSKIHQKGSFDIGEWERSYNVRKVFLKARMIKRLLPTWITSGFIGNIVGIIPGAGMSIGTFVAYNFTKSMNPKLKFGTGVPEGIAAPEVANNSVVASSMIPLLSLGIPGNATSALFIAALMIYGMRPGPLLFKDEPEIVYMMIAGFLVANVFMGPLGLLMGKGLIKALVKIPKAILYGAIMGICVTGCYAVTRSIEDLWVMIFFGLLCYILKAFGFSSIPLILGMVLGPMIENNLWQSLAISNGRVSIFFTRPISLFILILSIIVIIIPHYIYKK